MSDNKKKMKKAAGYAKPVMTQEENDLMMNRLMLGFVLAVCAVTLVMMLKNSYNTIQVYDTVAPVMSVLCLVLFAGAAVFFGLRTRRRTDDSKKILTRWNVLSAGCVSLFCGLMFIIKPSLAFAYSVAMVIGACVLYFIWYIYPRAFFGIACMCLAEGFLIHAGFTFGTVRSLSGILVLLSRIGAVLLPVLAAVLVLLAAKKYPRALGGIALWQLIAVCAVALIGAALMWCSVLGIFFFAYHYALYAIAASIAAVGIAYTVKSI